jgi:hypothetical protein
MPGGGISNAGALGLPFTLPRPGGSLTVERRTFGPLIVTRIGVPHWSCDTCREAGRRQHRGRGTDELLEHHERTGHTVYTPE